MDSGSKDMYLKAVFEIEEQKHSARVTDIASVLSVSPASVTEMLSKLVKEGLVKHRPYYGVYLTKKGKARATRIIRKNRLLEKFLCDILKMPKSAKDACNMEHALSDEADQRLCILMGGPCKTPSGKPIPHCSKPTSCARCLRQNARMLASPNSYVNR
ncbi:MAG: metal-dependent transcriptional regulator [Candidatus Micrarchaeota archaeon]